MSIDTLSRFESSRNCESPLKKFGEMSTKRLSDTETTASLAYRLRRVWQILMPHHCGRLVYHITTTMPDCPESCKHPYDHAGIPNGGV